MKKILSLLLITIFTLPILSGNQNDIHTHSGNYGYLSQSAIRLHILADGDDDISREIKLSVRDAVISEFSDEMNSFGTKYAAMRGIENMKGRIKEFVDDYLGKINAPYLCSVELAESLFPDRTYDDILFPAGKYTALKISLGSGKGQNWWCVMYPPLCFANTYDDENIPDDEVEVRWKILEWWEEFVSK